MPEEGDVPADRPAVFDATVLINFGQIGAFDILHQIYAGRAVVVEEVINEVRDRRSRVALRRAIAQNWMRSYRLEIPEELYWLGRFLDRLGPGEAASLAAAKVRGWRFASDDLTARQIAERELPPNSIFGSIGILLKAVSTGTCTVEQADRLHATMVASGYHSPVSSLRKFLEGHE